MPELTSVRMVVIGTITAVAEENNKPLLPLLDELTLSDSGLDSLSMAIIVARLDDELEVDPFGVEKEDGVMLPITIGDLIQLYEEAVSQIRKA